jgi:hypothetical protein
MFGESHQEVKTQSTGIHEIWQHATMVSITIGQQRLTCASVCLAITISAGSAAGSVLG